MQTNKLNAVRKVSYGNGVLAFGALGSLEQLGSA
jgi:hypothetical protein